MSLTDEHAAPAYRRAAALMVHHTNRDTQGMAAVLNEIRTSTESTALVFALVRLFDSLLPELRTTTGVALMREFIASAAAQEGQQS